MLSKSYYLLNDEVLDSTRFEQVEEITSEALHHKELKSKHDFYINHCIALFKQKKFQQAINMYDKALKQYPASYQIYYNKGLVYEELENYSEAAEMYKKRRKD